MKCWGWKTMIEEKTVTTLRDKLIVAIHNLGVKVGSVEHIVLDTNFFQAFDKERKKYAPAFAHHPINNIYMKPYGVTDLDCDFELYTKEKVFKYDISKL